ncbi:cytochrome c1 [Pseudaquabacterium pictum]|uniref:Cytochrome c n=1 Tax=Pseudaquabacterium pictum TaxID=2315236 RepID=A0A480ANN8_9BURK|nr:cytochrome c1 [Rubrivivax pictus]GCL62350.1 cytochrome c [Rubrivivax pictus]
MKRLIASLLAALAFCSPVLAAGGDTPPWDKFPKERVTDMAALQNGAKLFVNHCLNCHAAAFMRFNRLKDIGLTDEQIKKNLLFTTDKVGDLMTVSLSAKDAKDWFGAQPPDLTVIARSRSAAGKGTGADYLYSYMRGFYRDETRPTGWNNLYFPAVGMPHVLWEMQGEQRAKFVDEKDPHDPAKTVHVFKGFEQSKPGTMSKADYDLAVADLVAYLQWMGEPAQTQRVRMGVWVLLFLAVFTLIAWRLNAAFWKDVK